MRTTNTFGPISLTLALIFGAALNSCLGASFPLPGDRNVRMLVLGDSITWGQGLVERDKMHTQVANMLVGCDSDLSVSKLVLAHSGAHIEVTHDSSTRLGGEIPSATPSVMRQVDLFTGDTNEIDIVLMDGGINDVGVFDFIINPLVDSATISDRVETFCFHSMTNLLTKVASRFPNARIVVTGYYPIVSDKSNLDAMLAVFVGITGAIIVDLTAKARMVENSRVFATESRTRLRAAVAEVNDNLGGRARIFFADPGFDEDNSLFAPNSHLWEVDLFSLDPPLAPLDPVAHLRFAECGTNNFDTLVFGCQRASVGHPTERGEMHYTRAVMRALLSENRGLVWADFSIRCLLPSFCGSGLFESPFGKLADAVAAVPEGGTIRIKASSASQPITITKKCVLEACGSAVVIGL